MSTSGTAVAAAAGVFLRRCSGRRQLLSAVASSSSSSSSSRSFSSRWHARIPPPPRSLQLPGALPRRDCQSFARHFTSSATITATATCRGVRGFSSAAPSGGGGDGGGDEGGDAAAADAAVPTIALGSKLSFKTIVDGSPMRPEEFEGKAVLVVNTASLCG